MARKYANKNKPFRYKIHIFDSETYEEEHRRRREARMRMVVETIGWKEKALNRIRMRFTHQVSKMRQQILRPWWCYYSVADYGAPGEREFLCPRTCMKARRIDKDHAFFFREYYAKSIKASQAILHWLSDLDPYEYTFELHSYLLRLIVVELPSQHWIEKYERHCANEILHSLRG